MLQWLRYLLILVCLNKLEKGNSLMTNCESCGRVIPDNAVVCPNCGAVTSASWSQSQPPSYTPPQQGYMPPQQGFMPPQQQGYMPPQQQGYMPPQQQGYMPPQQGFMPPQQQGYMPPQQGFMPPQQQGYM